MIWVFILFVIAMGVFKVLMWVDKKESEKMAIEMSRAEFLLGKRDHLRKSLKWK